MSYKRYGLVRFFKTIDIVLNEKIVTVVNQGHGDSTQGVWQ